MAAITIRNLSDETHRALRHRPLEHGRSTEAEVRAILDEAIRPEGRLKIGSAYQYCFGDNATGSGPEDRRLARCSSDGDTSPVNGQIGGTVAPSSPPRRWAAKDGTRKPPLGTGGSVVRRAHPDIRSRSGGVLRHNDEPSPRQRQSHQLRRRPNRSYCTRP